MCVDTEARGTLRQPQGGHRKAWEMCPHMEWKSKLRNGPGSVCALSGGDKDGENGHSQTGSRLALRHNFRASGKEGLLSPALVPLSLPIRQGYHNPLSLPQPKILSPAPHSRTPSLLVASDLLVYMHDNSLHFSIILFPLFSHSALPRTLPFPICPSTHSRAAHR